MGFFNGFKNNENEVETKVDQDGMLNEEELEQITAGIYYTEQEKKIMEFKKRNYLTDEDWNYINSVSDEKHKEELTNLLANRRYYEYTTSQEQNQRGKSR